jgi:predicted small secreted protein
MKKRTAALLAALLILTVALTACKGNTPPDTGKDTTAESVIFAENAVTARNLDALSNEAHTVMMLALLKDGWLMDVSFGMLYQTAPGSIQGMAYEAVSDDIFRWKPEGEAAQTDVENPNTEMRIIYSDPQGRFIVYAPNVDAPDMANIILNPDHFLEIADESSVVIDKNYKYFYKIKDPELLRFSKSLTSFGGFDDAAVME